MENTQELEGQMAMLPDGQNVVIEEM